MGSTPARCFHHEGYTLEWGDHVFPTAKYRRLRDRIVEEGLLTPDQIHAAPYATREEVLAAHTARYLDHLEAMTATPELGYYEFEAPCTSRVLDAFLLMTGGTIAASRTALETGLCFNLGGGFHHAFAYRGEGFCALNDIAVAIRVMQGEGSIRRAAVIDLDLHQGNGTAKIFEGDPDVFTFSIHQENNYPVKQRSSLDVGLRDLAGDEEYLAALERSLPRVLEASPRLVLYVAGADPYEKDQLGQLRLTKEGFRLRDRMVFEACFAAGAAVVPVLAGGYATDPEDVVDIHLIMVREGLLARGWWEPLGP